MRRGRSGAAHPRFPVKSRGFRTLHAPFLKRKAHTQSCLGPRAGNSGHLARFSRDVGYHGSRRATLSVSSGTYPDFETLVHETLELTLSVKCQSCLTTKLQRVNFS